MVISLDRSQSPIEVAEIDSGVWGFYNLNTGKIYFGDKLAKWLWDNANKLPELISSQDITNDHQSQIELRIKALNGLLAARCDTSSKSAALRDIVLVDPPCPHRMIGTRGPAKGLCYLRDAIFNNATDWRVGILDLRSVSDIGMQSEADWATYSLRFLQNWSPAVFGITAVSATIENAKAIGRVLAALFPNARFVMGGPHASYEWRQLLTEEAWLSAVVIGEGEGILPILVERLANHEAFSDLVGVAWRDANGEPKSNGWALAEENLDILGGADDSVDVLNLDDYEIKHARVITSRGCPFKCSFCSTAEFTGRRVRYRSARNVVDELLAMKHMHGLTSFSLDDDIFTVNKKRVHEICHLILEEPALTNITWGCNTRMDCIDEKIVSSMYEAGCRTILFGIESGDPEIQQRFGKGRRGSERFQGVMTEMLRLGIEPQLNFILGLPGETRDTIELIDQLIADYPSVVATFNFLNLFPGTPLKRESSKFGLSPLQDVDPYSLTRPTVSTGTLSAYEQIECFLSLHWRRYLRAGKTRDDLFVSTLSAY